MSSCCWVDWLLESNLESRILLLLSDLIRGNRISFKPSPMFKLQTPIPWMCLFGQSHFWMTAAWQQNLQLSSSYVDKRLALLSRQTNTHTHTHKLSILLWYRVLAGSVLKEYCTWRIGSKLPRVNQQPPAHNHKGRKNWARVNQQPLAAPWWIGWMDWCLDVVQSWNPLFNCGLSSKHNNFFVKSINRHLVCCTKRVVNRGDPVSPDPDYILRSCIDKETSSLCPDPMLSLFQSHCPTSYHHYRCCCCCYCITWNFNHSIFYTPALLYQLSQQNAQSCWRIELLLAQAIQVTN